MAVKLMNKEDAGGGGADDNTTHEEVNPGAEQNPGGETNTGDEPGGEDEPEFEYFEEDKKDDKGPKGKKDEPVKTGLNISRFKEIDPDIEDEDALVNNYRKQKEDIDNLRIVAAGRDVIDADKKIQQYRALLDKSHDELAYMSLVQDQIDAGVPTEQARIKAKAKFDKIKGEDDGDDKIEDMALNTKKSIRGGIEERQEELLDAYKKAKGATELNTKDNKVVDKAKSEVTSFDSFMGFKLPATHKDKVLNAAQAFIGSKEEAAAFNDPKTRAEIAMFLAHKKQWEQNVRNRKSGKIEAVKKAVEHPKVGNGRLPKPVVKNKGGQGSGGIMKDPGAFLGKAIKTK